MTAILQPVSPPEIIFKSKMSSSNAARSPDRGSIQRVAANALQTRNVTVDRFHGSLFRTFKLQPSPEFFYILRCRPSMSVRLLRHEEDRLHTEAYILQALRGRSDLLVPRLIECQSTTAVIGSPYLISGPFKGVLLSDIEAQLSKQALASIDRSMGTFVKRLTYITGTHFGPLHSSTPSSTSHSWSKCFANMLESILRDAEDALVSLPYDFIRDQIFRHRASLDQITQPKLVLVEMVRDQNIVVDPKSCTTSGLLDWSTAVWGDPYLSDCFYNPSVGFVEGFGKLPNGTTEERIRQYLYILYHALLAIVRQCYRPTEDGDELAARRNLTSALTQLNSIPR
ncbi:Putative aminoglycoside phosphotransferase, protein kinase-like domain superfamily [Septoria linicola]|uniref:Aminoglycoside phosphotransferase, protein kinase-like domain superfamily n=1 Tax=Septoria linicola TaxID=215465 RepID=A0A9Q9ERW7_9PEZI|nr:putative aminoglycoside phosphotransferase, protein kinase-like domain superfamily [Septoria linicola]USW58998.1 Putative aminoglycoside phosphotransferase, protein kinase-like domain superfamily [Septoria linicola]